MTWERLWIQQLQSDLAEQCCSGAVECSPTLPAEGYGAAQGVQMLKVVLLRAGLSRCPYMLLCRDATSSDQNYPEDHCTLTHWTVKTWTSFPVGFQKESTSYWLFRPVSSLTLGLLCCRLAVPLAQSTPTKAHVVLLQRPGEVITFQMATVTCVREQNSQEPTL